MRPVRSKSSSMIHTPSHLDRLATQRTSSRTPQTNSTHCRTIAGIVPQESCNVLGCIGGGRHRRRRKAADMRKAVIRRAWTGACLFGMAVRKETRSSTLRLRPDGGWGDASFGSEAQARKRTRRWKAGLATKNAKGTKETTQADALQDL